MRSRHPLAGAFCHTKMLLLTALSFNTPAAHAQSGSVEIPGSTLGFGGGVADQQLTRQSFVDQPSGISVRENAYEIRIELEADVLFDFDKADIRPSAARALHQAANCSASIRMVWASIWMDDAGVGRRLGVARP